MKSFSFSETLAEINNMDAVYAIVFVYDQDETSREVFQTAVF